MKIDYPYEPRSVRVEKAWKEAGEIAKLPPIVVSEYYIDRYFTGMEAKDFIRLLKKGEIKIDLDIVKKYDLKKLAEKGKELNKIRKDSDFADFLDWQVKNLIEIGDRIVSDEDRTFLSGGQYKSKGKKYKVLDLKDQGGSSFGYTTNSDIKGEIIYGCVHSVRSLWRGRKEIFNWNLAYLNLWMEQNPNHDQTEEMRKYSLESAEKTRRGER